MLRILLPFFIFSIAIIAIIYIRFVKKDKIMAKKTFSLSLFFAVIWVGLYYFLFLD